MELDLYSPTFWVTFIAAVCLWITWINEQFGLAVVIPSTEQMAALATIIITIALLLKAFISRNPIFIRTPK